MSLDSSTKGAREEQVSITISAPDSSAKEANRPKRRAILGVNCPLARMSFSRPSSTRWITSTPGKSSEANSLKTGTSEATECTMPTFRVIRHLLVFFEHLNAGDMPKSYQIITHQQVPLREKSGRRRPSVPTAGSAAALCVMWLFLLCLNNLIIDSSGISFLCFRG
ncbi:hypothetical protein ES703_80340 [subsurface metagenome]